MVSPEALARKSVLLERRIKEGEGSPGAVDSSR